MRPRRRPSRRRAGRRHPGGVIRQISLPHEQVAQVRRGLAHYRKLKAALEKICELNQRLLRSENAGAKARRPR